ncbi:uncharacterized protein LOC126469834 isoform X1 [Schistocerca serialis cubense]|uniref:uncharacterized protein LOC126469834 isoform X1 n=1 Tax=Schistocerca serialis cubense TaxID=2023355 RepID=UPI00214E95BF|nr:uncharacterized protein LOC126469834 isoform X1 [Schistocerca serialis cubense]
MHPVNVTASLLVLLAANGTTLLDCVCNRLANVKGLKGLTFGEKLIRWDYCTQRSDYKLYATCENLRPPSTVAQAVSYLRPATWSYQPPLSADGDPWLADEEQCDVVMAAIRDLSQNEAWELSNQLVCRIAADCVHTCTVQWLNDTEWNATTLAADHVRRPILSQLVHAVRRITKAIHARRKCEDNIKDYLLYRRVQTSEIQSAMRAYMDQMSNSWREYVQLLSHGVTHATQLFIPLAFEYMGNHTNDEQLRGWFKNMERLRDMLHTKLRGWVHDMTLIGEQIANYKIEEDKNSTVNYIIRRPQLTGKLLTHQGWSPYFRDDFSEICEVQQPQASQMFGLADALYSFYHSYWFCTPQYLPVIERSPIDEKWLLEDRSNATLSVDTTCMQLLANLLDNPTCPLEDLPPETIKQREQCRVQLWDDMVQRLPHIPVTSYLAYTQRVNVNICLLAWMTVNSFGICQDVPFSMIQSVHDARCYFDSPYDQSCLESNAKDAICFVSRATLLLKCRDFSSLKLPKLCDVKIYADGSNKTFTVPEIEILRGNLKPTKTTLYFKESLNDATLRYKDFKIDNLKFLETSFIVINIIFRLLTVGVHMYLPQLRNLPGKILMSFQMTGIIQILCSEVMYRMVGIPDLSSMVLIDSALTLLTCIWLSTFCYQMCSCIRHLRLPNDLQPAEARKVFRRQVLYALIPWSMICAASITLEYTDKDYLIYSRIIFIVGISLSVSFNLVCLGIVGYMYLRNKKYMSKLKVYSKDKYGSKKQFVYLSVKAVVLSGIGIIIRMGFHQAQGVAQSVYYVHIATMMQGPVLFVFFICSETTLPVLKNRVMAWWNPEIIRPGQELGSAAVRNLARRRNEQVVAGESKL